MNKRRAFLLNKLLDCDDSFDYVASQLREFPSDYAGAGVLLTRERLLRVLRKYLEGDISADHLEKWADFIECRDDIDMEPAFEEDLLSVIYELANPYLTTQLNREKATRLADLLAHRQ